MTKIQVNVLFKMSMDFSISEQTHLCVDAFVYMSRGCWVLFFHSLSIPLREVFPLDLELSWQPASASVPSVSVPYSSPTAHWGCRYTWIFMWC